MKVLFFILFMGSLQAGMQEDRLAYTYICKDGQTHFFSSAPIEDISATCNNSLCVLNIQTKKISARVRMASFVFPNKLMQEHFNENYMESDKFPNGILEAHVVENIDFSKDCIYDVTLKGTFEIHGVKKDREIKGKITVVRGQPASATAQFDVKLADHNIKIPTALVAKIAEVIKVDVDFKFQKYHE
jgi:hypothetical protein